MAPTQPSVSMAAPAPAALGAEDETRSVSIADDKRPELDVAAYVDQPHFNQLLTLPATEDHGELTVSYAVGGSLDRSAPTVLFMGGMNGSRYFATISDYLCLRMGVRMVVADRPGMATSTPVPVSQRIAVWLKTVPILLQAIGAKHVALASHSCGVIYALNMLYTMPHILHPQNRTVCLFTPWVPPEHSRVKILSLASQLPTALISRYDSLVMFVEQRLTTPIASSCAVLDIIPRTASKLFTSREQRQKQIKAQKLHRKDMIWRLLESSGCICTEDVIDRQCEIHRRVLEEGIRGAADEALLCLRKAKAGPWGVCDSYKDFPEQLDEALKNQFWNEKVRGAKVVVRAIWAEEDSMIEKEGEKYFDDCFASFDGARKPACLDYRKETWANTNHDSIPYPYSLALTQALEEMLRVSTKPAVGD